jgi:hypothetical protein
MLSQRTPLKQRNGRASPACTPYCGAGLGSPWKQQERLPSVVCGHGLRLARFDREEGSVREVIVGVVDAAAWTPPQEQPRCEIFVYDFARSHPESYPDEPEILKRPTAQPH